MLWGREMSGWSTHKVTSRQIIINMYSDKRERTQHFIPAVNSFRENKRRKSSIIAGIDTSSIGLYWALGPKQALKTKQKLWQIWRQIDTLPLCSRFGISVRLLLLLRRWIVLSIPRKAWNCHNESCVVTLMRQTNKQNLFDLLSKLLWAVKSILIWKKKKKKI